MKKLLLRNGRLIMISDCLPISIREKNAIFLRGIKRVFMAMVTVLSLTGTAMAQVNFGAPTDFTTGSGPRSVAIGDVNGDGKLDLAVSDASINKVSILLGTGTGSFGINADYTTGTSPTSIAIGDFNRDGYLDLVTANNGGGSNGNNVSVLLGNGNGSFGTKTDFAMGTGSESVGISDLNNDGYLDIAVANASFNSVTVRLGNGDGTFQTRINYSVGSSQKSIAISDLNGDGKPDLVTAKASSNNVSVLLGTGTGAFGAASHFSTGNSPYSVVIGDISGDGKQDLITANYGSSTVSVLLGNGDGTFQAKLDYTTGTSPYSVAIGDVNGDSKLDLVTANYDDNKVSVLQGNGDGTFGTNTDFTTGTNPMGLAIGDVSGDGKLDLVTANNGSTSVSVLLNQTSSSPTISSVSATAYTNLALVNFSVNPNGNATTYRVRVGNSPGSYTASYPATPASAGSGSSPVAKTVLIPFLTQSSTYYYSVQATNADGTTNFSEQSFVAPAPNSTATSPSVGSSVTGTFVLGSTGASVTFTGASGSSGALTGAISNVVPPGTTIPALHVAPRYWTVTNTGLTGYTYAIQLDLTGIPGISNYNTLTFYKRDNSGSAWADVTSLGATVYISAPYVLITDLTSFSDFGIGGGSDNPLPVELTAFSGLSTNAGIKLNWTTQSETNNAGFVLYRNGEEIASYRNTKGLQGQGSKSGATNYVYTDAEAELGLSYTYKLRSVDRSGQIHDYTQKVSLKMTEAVAGKSYTYSLDQNYPNPFNPSTTIRYQMKESGIAKLTVYDVLGRAVVSNSLQASKGWNSYNMNASGLGTGVYFYRLSVGGKFDKTMKMMVVK